LRWPARSDFEPVTQAVPDAGPPAMRISLDQVRREPVSWDEDVRVGVEELGRDDIVELSPVHWKGRMSRAEIDDEEDGFYLSARFAYEQTLACHRCLEPVRQPVAAEVRLLLVRDAPQAMEGEHQLGEEDLGIVHVASDEVDTRPLLLEQMQLAVPMKPLCREGCKGLCPRCGINLDSGQCECEDDWVDPRWAALAKLKAES
jgi:uncharacterized protein